VVGGESRRQSEGETTVTIEKKRGIKGELDWQKEKRGGVATRVVKDTLLKEWAGTPWEGKGWGKKRVAKYGPNE